MARASADRAVVAALLSGGDHRIAVDPTGRNGYLIPPEPAPHILCASSCTASPIAAAGFDAAATALDAIEQAGSSRDQRIGDLARHIEARLLAFFGVAGLAEATIHPSGTDALAAAARRVAAERPDAAVTAILPNRSETGTGVPHAASPEGRVIEVALRDADGEPRPLEAVNEAYAAAARTMGRTVAYLTHGTKTGLVAPTHCPGCDVIVDACQARINPSEIAGFLARGWPVALTGSKFYGGPAFSGVLLFPSARARAAPWEAVPHLGTVLRWEAAWQTMAAVGASAPGLDAFIQRRGQLVQQGIRSQPELHLVGGTAGQGPGWSRHPSIFSFAVRNPADGALLPMQRLRPLYERVARAGVLLGQPVDLGPFGGLRIAIGARDFLAGEADVGLPQLFEVLARSVSSG